MAGAFGFPYSSTERHSQSWGGDRCHGWTPQGITCILASGKAVPGRKCVLVALSSLRWARHTNDQTTKHSKKQAPQTTQGSKSVRFQLRKQQHDGSGTHMVMLPASISLMISSAWASTLPSAAGGVIAEIFVFRQEALGFGDRNERVLAIHDTSSKSTSVQCDIGSLFLPHHGPGCCRGTVDYFLRCN